MARQLHAKYPASQLLCVVRMLSLFVLACALMGCGSRAYREVKRASRLDPASLVLERAYNDYVRRAHLSDGTEVGIISCRDGSSARFWFRSHHLTRDDGGTWFRFSDGTEIFMSGYFCCEVQLPERPLDSLNDLRAFIQQHDGISP